MTRFHIPRSATLVHVAPNEWLDPSCDDDRESVDRIGDRVLILGMAPIHDGFGEEHYAAFVARVCSCCDARFDGNDLTDAVVACDSCQSEPWVQVAEEADYQRRVEAERARMEAA